MPSHPPPPAVANDDGAVVRMVPLIGEVHDDGRFVRYPVVELLRVPVSLLRRHGPQEP